MVDVLIVVERSATEHPDIIGQMIQKDLRKYFQDLDITLNDIPAPLQSQAVEMVPNHGMAGTVSLTSVVLATALKQAGVSFGLFDDDDIPNKHGELFLERVRQAKVVAISTTYIIARKHVLNLLKAVRDVAPDVPVILGGQGIPSLKLDPFSEGDKAIFDMVDYVVYGDGEDAFPELCQDVLNGDTATAREGVLSKADGAWGTKPVPRTADLEIAPVPDYSILRDTEINGALLGDDFQPDYASLEEGRGCAFRCRFCSYHVFSTFRRKSPERIVAELKAVKEQGFDNASFVGAEFMAPIKHSTKVLQAIIDADLNMNIWLYARLDLCARHPEIFPLLKKAGANNLVFGMESGAEVVLRNMKKFFDVEGMVEGAILAREMGFELMASIILGYPGETKETLATTTDVLRRCNFDQVFLHALNVLPDTPLWDLREEFGMKVSTKTGYWAHKTFALKDVPEATKEMMDDLNRTSDSVFINVIRNLAPGFVRPGKDYSNRKLEEISSILQDILSLEWSGEPDREKRLAVWRRLSENCTQLPPYVLQAARDHEALSAAGQ